MERIITIGRQYGSNGTAIGRTLARQLAVPFYDRNTLKDYAVQNGMGKALMESYGEKHASSLLLTLSTSAFSFGYYDASRDSAISQKAYLTAFETIREISKQGPCVIVGRCADYVLKDDPQRLSLFIHAPMAARVETVSGRDGIDPAEAEQTIREWDHLRRNYYNYYTRKEWGAVNGYHASIDSSAFGIEGTAALIRQAELLHAPPDKNLAAFDRPMCKAAR